MKKVISLIAAILMLLSLAACGGVSNDALEPSEETTAPDSFAGDYRVQMKIKDYGTITLELDSESAPATVENFVKLAREGFYDGLTFHRIINNFMIQGGDPKGNGTGGSEQTIVGEFKSNGYNNNLKHTRGAISMARSSAYDSASSQFFIVQADSPHLNGEYACFGYVTSGMNIVDKICEDAKPTDGNGTITASEQPVIESVTVTEISK